ncbi:MAG: hypothetical protein JMDDDDMK_05235 [Acidobacteria bacterium]|nr:hypothetical protein [Acidobacteriota bacterium]
MFDQKIIHQNLNIVATVTQRRDAERDDVQAVIQILAETSVFDHRFEVAVGRAEHAHVNFDRACAADARDFFFLQGAQQFGLHALTHFADFIQKERAFVGDFKQAFLFGMRAGERAFFVAKQFRFEQVLIDRGAVDGLKPFSRSRAGFVDGAGDALFAGARFAADQHG